MFLALAKGQEELKALVIKEKTKKPKKQVGILKMGRRLRGPVKRAIDLSTPSNEGDNHEEDNNPGTDEDEADYSEEQYPSTDDKYKQLEDRLNAMEIQQIPGLDFEELGFVSGVVIPPKFKIPNFVKYDGISYPKMHMRLYVCKIQPHTADRKYGSISSKKVWLAPNWSGSIS